MVKKNFKQNLNFFFKICFEKKNDFFFEKSIFKIFFWIFSENLVPLAQKMAELLKNIFWKKKSNIFFNKI